MANETTSEIFSVNGVALNTLAKNIESLTGRMRAPAKRTSNTQIPGMHGTLRQAGKKYEEQTLILPMWVLGCEDDGSIPDGGTARRLFFRNVSRLAFLFAQEGPLDVRHVQPSGEVFQLFADVLDTIDFSVEGGNPIGKFSVALTVPGVFWQDLDQRSVVYDVSGITNLSLNMLTGATAPMEDLTFIFTGPWNNPVLTFADGSSLTIGESIAAGTTRTVNAATWTYLSSTTATPNYGLVTARGTSSSWVAVPPAGEAAPVVQLSGTGRTTASKLTVTGRRKHLIG